jgi:hypothetical protein
MVVGLTLGGYSLLSSQIFLTAFKNGSFPATVYTRSKRGGYSGSKLITPTFASYQLVLDFTIVGKSFSDLCTQRDAFFGLLGLIHSLGAQTLISTRSDGTQRQIDIKAVQVTGDMTADDGTQSIVEVTLEAEYPFLMGSQLKTIDVLIYNGGGFAVPFGIPFDMSAGHSTTISVTNSGNYAAYPTFTFIGQLTTPAMVNNTTGKTLSISTNLADSAHSLVVDSYLRTAVLQTSGNNGRQYVSGDFWTIPPGTSNITLSNNNMTDGGKVTLTYRDTWLNI